MATLDHHHHLRRLAGYGCVGLAVFLTGCGGSEQAEPETTQTASEVQEQRPGNIDPAKIEKCAGFTSETAARILGVPAGEIVATNEPLHETLRIYSFRSRSDVRKTIAFSLGWESSAEEAEASMAREREMLGMARRSIGAATGSEDKGPTLQEISGLGDEAYYTRVNGTLNARLSNVAIQVITAPDLEAYKEVAREVFKGLR